MLFDYLIIYDIISYNNYDNFIKKHVKFDLNYFIRFDKIINYDNFIENINQNKFDALCCFAYNVGVNALKSSTLLKKVNINPNDPTIKNEFLKWNKANGRALTGLTKRRQEEADLYGS